MFLYIIQQFPNWSLTVWKDLINIIFWIINILFLIITAIIGTLTYKSAKRTLLQPIKTEIFKEQVKEFSKVLEFFNSKNESKLREFFFLEKMLTANIQAMYDSYANTFFDLKIEKEKRLYSKEKCSSAIITQESMEKYFELAEEHTQSSFDSDSEEDVVDNRVRAAIWGDYEHVILHIPNETRDRLEELNHIKSSPLLTKELYSLITEFERTIKSNFQIIRTVVEESAKEMPRKYISVDTLKSSSILWINSKFTSKFNYLEKPAQEIIDYIRNYYKVDEMLKK